MIGTAEKPADTGTTPGMVKIGPIAEEAEAETLDACDEIIDIPA